MTIKPIIAPSQKRMPSAESEKQETHQHGGHNSQVVIGEQQNLGQQNVRSTAPLAPHRNVVIDNHGQSTQRRGEETSRNRRSPQKSSRSKRRELHDHHKRERPERVLDKHSNTSASSKCSSPHSSSSTTSSTSNGVSSGSVNVGNQSPEHISSIPVVLGCQGQQSQAAVVQSTTALLQTTEDAYSGYNSGDEHLQAKGVQISPAEWKKRDEQFIKCMSERGYVLKAVEEDGACLFRAISLQIYGDEDMHDVIRQHTMDYINKNREYFSQFVTEDINSYIKRKRQKDSHGNHIEIQAMSEIYNRPVEVYCYKPTPINIFNSEQFNNGYAPLRLSYQRGSHYNAIIDPYNATVGVGLGLAGYKPDLQMKEAVLLSEQLEIEQTMFEDKLKTTDWEATNEAIEEQIARESYLQWCRENLQAKRSTPSVASSTTTSATVTSAEAASNALADMDAVSNLEIFTVGNIDKESADGQASVSASVSAAGSTSACATLSGIAFGVASKTTPFNANKELGDCDAGGDSDDTDASSTSLLGSQTSSATAPPMAKKIKSRGSFLRTCRKRRCAEPNPSAPLDTPSKSAPNAIEGALQNGTAEDASKQEDRATIPDAEQQPSTSKRTDKNTKNASSNENKPISSFYQELLQATYAGDGFEPLTESEMLQRAIQMSTHDYIEDQKRKYFS